MEGWNLVNNIACNSIVGFAKDDGSVTYNPSINYLYEKEDPENPLKKIRAGKYHSDRVKCVAPVTPAEYNQIRAMLATASMADPETGLGLYIQFDRAGEIKALPVYQVMSLPEMSDDLACFPDFIEFELESRYINDPVLPNYRAYGSGLYGADVYGF